MFGGYGSSFNIRDYAPEDPMNQLANFGFLPPANVPPPQQPGAQSSAAAPVQRSQSEQAQQQQRVDPRSISREQIQRDYARAPQYIPTPINGGNPKAGQAPAPPLSSPSSSSLAPPAAASATSSDNSKTASRPSQPVAQSSNAPKKAQPETAGPPKALHPHPQPPNQSPLSWITYRHPNLPPNMVLFRDVAMLPEELVQKLREYNLPPPESLLKRLPRNHPIFLDPNQSKAAHVQARKKEVNGEERVREEDQRTKVEGQQLEQRLLQDQHSRRMQEQMMQEQQQQQQQQARHIHEQQAHTARQQAQQQAVAEHLLRQQHTAAQIHHNIAHPGAMGNFAALGFAGPPPNGSHPNLHQNARILQQNGVAVNGPPNPDRFVQMMMANGQVPVQNGQFPMMPGMHRGANRQMDTPSQRRQAPPDPSPSQRRTGGADAQAGQSAARVPQQQEQQHQPRMNSLQMVARQANPHMMTGPIPPNMGQNVPNRPGGPPVAMMQPRMEHGPVLVPHPFPGMPGNPIYPGHPGAHLPPLFDQRPQVNGHPNRPFTENEYRAMQNASFLPQWPRDFQAHQQQNNQAAQLQRQINIAQLQPNAQFPPPPYHQQQPGQPVVPWLPVGIDDSSADNPPPVSNLSPELQDDPIDQKPVIKRIDVITLEDEEDRSRVNVKREPLETEEETDSARTTGARVQIKQEPLTAFDQYIDRRANEPSKRSILKESKKREEEQKLIYEEIQKKHEEEKRKIKEEADAKLKEKIEQMAAMQEELKTLKDKQDSANAQEPQSRSSSPGSDIYQIKKKKKVIEDSEEDETEGDKSRSQSRNKKKVRTARQLVRRPIVGDEGEKDDDEIPKTRGRKRASEEDSDYQQEEEEEEEDDEEVESDNAFINDEDEYDDSNSIEDFVCGNNVVEYDSDEERRRALKRKRKQSSSQSSKRPSTPPKTSKPKPSRNRRSIGHKEFVDEESEDEPDRKKRSRRGNRRQSTPEVELAPKTPAEIEKEKKLKKLKTLQTKEANRLKKHREQLQLMESTPIRLSTEARKTRTQGTGDKVLTEAFTEALATQKKQKLPQKPSKSASSVQHRRASESAPRSGENLQKRPTTDRDDETSGGTHVPAKRTAHANSQPSSSTRPRPASSLPGPSRRLPNQNELFEKRQREAEEKKRKEEEERARLQKKKYLTQEEMFNTNRPRIGSNQKGTDRMARPTHQVPAGTSRKVTIKKEVKAESEQIVPNPPDILDPTKGRSYLTTRMKNVERFFNYFYSVNPTTAAKEAQKHELEIATMHTDRLKYNTTVNHKLIALRRDNPNVVFEVNRNAVSHSQNLAGVKENFSVGKGSKKVNYSEMEMEELFPLLVALKMTDEELDKNAYPLFKNGPNAPVVFAETPYTKNKKLFLDDNDLTRTCNRCFKEFKLKADGTMVREKDICRYHHRGAKPEGKKQTFVKKYHCCGELINTVPGCMFKDVHTTDQLFKKELSKFVATPPPKHEPGKPDRNSTVAYAIDCEMVSTVEGPALARLSMVDMKGRLVLDLMIKPPSEVLDTNIEFSGLTMEQVMNAPDTLRSCHEKLFGLINSETILIGHSLESDLKAMRLVHKSVIDTAVLFAKADQKQALKRLMSNWLQKNIQDDNEDAVGHDSLEDARACIDLIFHGLKNPHLMR